MSDTLAAGRIGWWRFQGGSLEDSSGNGRTLTQVGIVTFVADKDGISNNAVSFAGTSNSLECAYSGSPENPYISAWVKCVTPNSGTEILVAIRGIEQFLQGFELLLLSGIIGWGTNIGSSQESLGIYNISDGNFHHCFLQYDKANGRLSLYVDKILRGTSFAGVGIPITYANVNKIQFGIATNYPYESNDIIDEVMIGDRVLTGGTNTIGATATGEIAQLYDMGVNYITLNSITIDNISSSSAILYIASNEDSTAYYEIRESPTNNAEVGDILTEPESGWTRYYASDTSMFIIEEYSFKMTSEFRKNLKVGDKLRILYAGNVLNDIYEIWGADLSEGYSFAYASMIAIDIVLPPPTPEELKTTHTGTIALTAVGESQVEITGLTENTEYDIYIVAEDIAGNLQTTVTKLEFKTNKLEEEEEMKEIMIGLIFLKLRVVGTTEWTELGDSKTEAKFKYEEKFADVKTVESGNVDKVLESTTASLEVGISQLSKALIDKLSASINSVTEGIAPDEITYLEGGAGIGTVATKYEVIAHPIEEGTGTEYDIYLPKATIETSIDKTGKAGEQLVFNLKIEGLYDREQKCKFRIGKNPA